MLAISLPGAARALGLGDIRVNSALNEPLSAQIDLMGATPEELLTLTAQLADEAMFHRYGAERPSYLASVRFKVAMDSKGRPVLEVHSAAPFADPIVNFLVDLRWPKGELIRDFSLLLDPAAYAPGSRGANTAAVTEPLAELTPVSLTSSPVAASPALAITPASPAPAGNVTVHSAIPAPSASPIDAVYRVVARDTLFDIVRRAGAVTEADVQQMMIAIFRANPEAFDRNINLLHRGAVLTLPSRQDIEAVDAAEARRTVVKQMRAWKLYSVGAAFHPVGSGLIALPPSAQRPLESAPIDTLNSRVQTLEAALEAEQRQVASMKATIEALRPPLALPPTPALVPAIKPSPTPVAARVGTRLHAALWNSLALVLGLPLLGLAMLRRGRRQPAPTRRPEQEPHFVSVAEAIAASASIQGNAADQAEQPEAPATAVEMKAPVEHVISAQAEDAEATATTEEVTQLLEQLEADYAATAVSNPGGTVRGRAPSDTAEMDTVIIGGAPTDEAVLSAVEEQVAVKRLSTTVLDYNLCDLDSRAAHVHMPSELNRRTNFVERRKSIIDALRAAIDRDPLRRDLCMKLLETYHSTASANRRAFEQFVRLQTGGPNSLSAEDWQKILLMSREIALEISVPAGKEDDDLAHCA
jgi:FimV-like protein